MQKKNGLLKHDLSGKRFNYWTAISHVSHGMWLCNCSCGTSAIVEGKNLRHGKSKSCGCWKIEIFSARVTTHGHTSGRENTPEYNVYRNMLSRCYRKTNCRYPNYGGRGIEVCEEWKSSFQAFFDDMGKRPIGLTLDRIDVNGNYEPENCRWADLKTQARNKTGTVMVYLNGDRISLAEAAERTGIKYGTLHSRMRLGMSFDEAITKPTIRFIAEEFGVTPEQFERKAS